MKSNWILTHGYFLEQDEKEIQIRKPYPPLGLLSISGFLEKHAIVHEVIDTTFITPDEWKCQVSEIKPEGIAFYVNLMTKVEVLRLTRWVKQQWPGCQVVIGGPDVTYNVENYLNNGVDIGVVGEGENTLLEVVQGKSLPEIPGIVYKEGNTIMRNPPREKMKSLSDIPFPARHRIDMQAYLDTWKKAHGYSSISLSTQRGCPYTCKWCSTAVYGQSYRRRSVAEVCDEIEWLQKSYTFDVIWFVDDVFTVSHIWLSNFAHELTIRQIRIRFECITRADRMNAEVIGLLKNAGCFRVWIGAESGSQRIVDAMDRRVSVLHVREMIRSTRISGIETGTFIMLGYPGETLQDIEETLTHLREANPDYFTITVAYPIKGTALYNEVSSRIGIEPDWTQTTDREIDFDRNYPRKFYTHAVRYVVNSVQAHKTRHAGRTWTPTYGKHKVKSIISRYIMKWIAWQH